MNPQFDARSRATRAALLSGALCVLLSAVLAASASAAPRSFYGVMPQASVTAQDLDQMGKAKVGTLRFLIPWSRLDPGSSPNDGNWSSVDAIMAALAEGGVKPLPFVYGTPEWVAKLDGQSCNGDACEPFAPRTAAARAAWKEFLLELMQRYGRGGSFWQQNPSLQPEPITAVQILNEQNSPTFYKPKPNVKAYAKVLAASNEAITQVDPRAEVILGGMFGTPLGGRKPGIAAWDYLEQLYRVKGAKQSFDGVAPHPYAARMKKVVAQLDLFLEAMRKGHDRNAELWITEIGWASSGANNPLVRGARGQAARLTEAFKYFEKRRRKLNLETLIWYSWRDNLTSQLCEWCPGSGLLTEDYGKKPSYRAFVRFTGGT